MTLRCVTCGRQIQGDPRFPINVTDTPRCPKCFFRRLARRHLGNIALWPRLRDMFTDQAGRCRYTGAVLVLGGNASLDHRTPKSRGGSDHTKNLQWVVNRVNDAKGNMTHEEFVAMCREVASCAANELGTTPR